MSACPPFTITMSGDLQVVFDKATNAAARDGVRFQGDLSSGQFSGRGVAGKYVVLGNDVTITITALGFPASMMFNCQGIEGKIRAFFQN